MGGGGSGAPIAPGWRLAIFILASSVGFLASRVILPPIAFRVEALTGVRLPTYVITLSIGLARRALVDLPSGATGGVALRLARSRGLHRARGGRRGAPRCGGGGAPVAPAAGDRLAQDRVDAVGESRHRRVAHPPPPGSRGALGGVAHPRLHPGAPPRALRGADCDRDDRRGLRPPPPRECRRHVSVDRPGHARRNLPRHDRRGDAEPLRGLVGARGVEFRDGRRHAHRGERAGAGNARIIAPRRRPRLGDRRELGTRGGSLRRRRDGAGSRTSCCGAARARGAEWNVRTHCRDRRGPDGQRHRARLRAGWIRRRDDRRLAPTPSRGRATIGKNLDRQVKKGDARCRREGRHARPPDDQHRHRRDRRCRAGRRSGDRERRNSSSGSSRSWIASRRPARSSPRTPAPSRSPKSPRAPSVPSR